MSRRLFADYGMLFVLLILAAVFSVLTWSEQQPVGAAAAPQLARDAAQHQFRSALIVVREQADEEEFAGELQRLLAQQNLTDVEIARGQPAEVRKVLEERVKRGQRYDVIFGTAATIHWGVLEKLPTVYPSLAGGMLLSPKSYYWPNFLKVDNLLNIANQIAVIAMMAIGMTMVIITGHIDLSVGSLLALSSVIAARLIRDYAGGVAATPAGMVAACLAAISLGAAIGVLTGLITMILRIPSFIVTLAMMLIASGAAFLLANGQSIAELPESFVWLGRGADLLQIPNAVVLMLCLYAIAYVTMERTRFGRYLYAVGGNSQAAFLSGIPVRRIVVVAFALTGMLAGLGGVVLASQLRSGTPTYGQMYELYVIAATVVGGTSLAGGEGKVLGTLIGAFIIAVIQNGMNLLGVESYTQKVVLGLVILVAVLLDRLRRVGKPL